MDIATFFSNYPGPYKSVNSRYLTGQAGTVVYPIQDSNHKEVLLLESASHDVVAFLLNDVWRRWCFEHSKSNSNLAVTPQTKSQEAAFWVILNSGLVVQSSIEDTGKFRFLNERECIEDAKKRCDADSKPYLVCQATSRIFRPIADQIALNPELCEPLDPAIDTSITRQI